MVELWSSMGVKAGDRSAAECIGLLPSVIGLRMRKPHFPGVLGQLHGPAGRASGPAWKSFNPPVSMCAYERRLFDPDAADETTPADCRTYDHEKDLATLRRYDFFQCFPMEVDQGPELLTRCHLLADLDLRTEESCLARAHPDKPVESARRG